MRISDWSSDVCSSDLILGFLYAEGLAVKRDYVEAYRWYGLAFLAGEASVRANMDIVWALLQRHALEGAMAIAREFDALAAGAVPAGLAPDQTAPAPQAQLSSRPPPPRLPAPPPDPPPGPAPRPAHWP